MYKQVDKISKTPVAKIYENYLIENGHFTQKEVDEKRAWVTGHLEECYAKSKSEDFENINWKTEEWASILNTTTDEA
jgi:2-oxoglutarate dehydrogenase complex dehydrogenase (E1) component-like enzyme